MSKIPVEELQEGIQSVLKYSNETKKRNFLETIELQIGLKGYDTRKDKRFNGSIRLPTVVRPGMRVCVFGDVDHCEEAEALGVDSMNTEQMKSLNKDKKLVKNLAAKYHMFLASPTIIKQVPRLMGPGLNKAGKFPLLLTHDETLEDKLVELKSTVKFQLKKVLGLGVAIGTVDQDVVDIFENLNLAINFLVGMLKKHWQNVKTLHLKSTMGKPVRIY